MNLYRLEYKSFEDPDFWELPLGPAPSLDSALAQATSMAATRVLVRFNLVPDGITSDWRLVEYKPDGLGRRYSLRLS